MNCVAPSAATERPERTAAERRARTGHTSFAAPSARTAEQIAPMVAHLVGDQGSEINGRIFYVEGGQVSLYDPPLPRHTLIGQGLWAVEELAAACETAFGAALGPPRIGRR